MQSTTLIGIGLFVLGLLFLFRLFGLEAFEDTGAAGAAEPTKAAEAAPAEAATVPTDSSTDASARGPTTQDIASAQENSVGLAKQTVASTEGPVSPAESSTVITAPGVVRPAGAGSVRPSFPAAAGLEGTEGGPFESYVKMLVKSELSSLGVAEAAAEGFQAARATANAPLGDMVANATKQLQGSLHKVFGSKTGLRV